MTTACSPVAELQVNLFRPDYNCKAPAVPALFVVLIYHEVSRFTVLAVSLIYAQYHLNAIRLASNIYEMKRKILTGNL